jgi:integrase/recombinase XerD
MKKTDQALISYLTRDELQALLHAPDPRTASGIRDRAMLHLAFAAGLRVSELVSLRLDQVNDHNLSSVHIIGKDTVQNLGGLMRHGETGDGPIAQQSCDRC